MKDRFAALLVFFVFLWSWQAAVDAELVSPVLLPGPLAVGKYLLEISMDGTLLAALLTTFRRLLTGYGMGLGLGILLGLVVSRFNLARLTIGVAALGLQTLPSVCWAPLSLLWFGQSESAMIFVVVMGSLWSVIIAADTGVRSISPAYIKAARVMGSRGLHTWVTVIIPASLPFLVSGAKLGWAFAWRSLMAAEIYVSIMDHLGLGQLLHFGREFNAMDQVLAVIVVIVAMGLVVDRLVFSPVEGLLHRWWGTTAA